MISASNVSNIFTTMNMIHNASSNTESPEPSALKNLVLVASLSNCLIEETLYTPSLQPVCQHRRFRFLGLGLRV